MAEEAKSSSDDGWTQADQERADALKAALDKADAKMNDPQVKLKAVQRWAGRDK